MITPIYWEFLTIGAVLGLVRHLYWPDIYQALLGGGSVRMWAYVRKVCWTTGDTDAKLKDYVMMGARW